MYSTAYTNPTYNSGMMPMKPSMQTPIYQPSMLSPGYQPSMIQSQYQPAPSGYMSPMQPMGQSAYHPYPQQQYLNSSGVTRASEDVSVYCPVCRTSYLNSQMEEHVERHYDGDVSYLHAGTSKDMHKTAAESLSYYGRAKKRYPMVQPLEFYTSQLDEVNLHDKFFIQRHDEGRVNTGPTHVVESSAQTARKPPLQYWKKQSDMFNFMDNAFNSNSKFSFMDDVVKNNKVVAGKRHLNDWEKAKHNK